MQEILNKLEEVLMVALLAFMTLLTFTQVIMRYVFNSGWVWSLEATTYAFAALVLVGMSYGVRTKTHIAIDLVTRNVAAGIRRYVSILAVVCCLAYALLMLYGSGVLIQKLFVLGNMARDIPVPKWLLTATAPLGFTLLSYRFLEAGWRLIKHEDEVFVSDKLEEL